MHGHPQDPNANMYGNDGRQDGQQGLNCPNCKHFIYYTLEDAVESTDLVCEVCGKTYAVSMTDPTGKQIKAQIGGSLGTSLFIGDKVAG